MYLRIRYGCFTIAHTYRLDAHRGRGYRHPLPGVGAVGALRRRPTLPVCGMAGHGDEGRIEPPQGTVKRLPTAETGQPVERVIDPSPVSRLQAGDTN
jgi:hypothetical protein